MGLISKIKEGLNHNSDDVSVHSGKDIAAETSIASSKAVASTDAIAVEKKAVASEKVVAKEANVVAEEKVIDVPINTRVAEADVTVVQAPTEEVQVKTAEAIVQEKKDIHEEIEVTPVVDRVVDETEVRQTIVPVRDEVNEATSEERVMATDKRNITEAPTDAVKAKYQEQSQAVQASYTEVEGEAEVHVAAPVVQEVHKKHIIEEVQPVIERVTHHTHKIHTTQPIQEHVVAAAKVADIKVKAPISMEEFKKSQLSSNTTALSSTLTGSSTAVKAQHVEKTAAVAETVPVVPVVPVVEAIEIREE